MFRLHRHKSDRSGEKVEFRFSNLQAFQVLQPPILLPSPLSYTILYLLDLGIAQFSLVLQGSARSVILGEIVLNLADYLSSQDSGSLLLPLKKCESGTTLQVMLLQLSFSCVKIQCTTPKLKFRFTII
ncbi:hypothetical protein BHE74_00034969 [Ensete ventricosum]|nr:hypothetical protein BHE74_00034969 [Ensete ventricosum]